MNPELDQRIAEARARAAAVERSVDTTALVASGSTPAAPGGVPPATVAAQLKLSLGAILAREWLYLNYSLWAAVLATLVVSYVQAPGHWQRREFWGNAVELFPILATLPYIAFMYLRSLWSAWRINTGKIPPPQLGKEDLKKLIELLPKTGKDDA